MLLVVHAKHNRAVYAEFQHYFGTDVNENGNYVDDCEQEIDSEQDIILIEEDFFDSLLTP